MPYKDPDMQRQRSREYQRRNRDKVRQRSRDWRRNNPDKNKASVKRWLDANPQKKRIYGKTRNLKRYGLTVAEYENMNRLQAGLCAICGRPETATRQGRTVELSVDHDHTTGVVRDLLCADCNRVIGMMDEDPARLESAAAYLRRHRDSPRSRLGPPQLELKIAV